MKKTVIFIAFIVVAIAVFDFYIIAAEGKQESISAYLIRWSHEYPSIPFLLGFTCAHLFWRMKDKDVNKKVEE